MFITQDRSHKIAPEETLVQKLRNEEEDAFGELIDRYQTRLLRLARSFVSSEAMAKEVVQAYVGRVRVIPVRCLGSVNFVWITQAMSAGFDGVILIGCKYGDDYQCHFIKGSELASVREKNVREKLEQMAMDIERVELHQLQIDEYDKLPGIFEKFTELIDEIGMNPFKGM